MQPIHGSAEPKQVNKFQFSNILHGGDYNPEQWPEVVWLEDVRLMKQAGINVATLPVFGWGNIQKDEDKWDFEWLDRSIALLHESGIRLCLATGTAAVPPWIDQKYPDILRVESDGRRRCHGARHTFCPNSPNFRRLSQGLARKMAERYGDHPALLIWHVSNEYGNHCYCDLCSAAFREWLKERYGSLQEVNQRWNMAFWGQTYTDWTQIEAPVDNGQRNFQGLLVDYNRFQSESILDCCRGEIAVLRELTPEIPITTNMMGLFKPLDYHAWAKELDIVSWDAYPARSATPSDIAFAHALMRGLKEGKPWMLMEQTPSQQNWQRYNSLKRPGVLRLWSYQAMAHGADSIMYFQWRRSPGAQEMFHGAVVEHAADPEARVFKEVAALGRELHELGDRTLGSEVEAEVAILFDWDCWWAVEFSSGPSVDLKYTDAARDAFRALMSLGIAADVVSPEADLSRYKLIVAPTLKMIKPGVAERLNAFVDGGGVLLATYFSGIVDETDRAFHNGYPGPLSEVLGIWVEETDALAPNETNAAEFAGGRFTCGLLCDRIHLRGAATLATYAEDFYSNEPCATQNSFGQGQAFYIGTRLDEDGWKHLAEVVATAANIKPTLGAIPPAGIEVTTRKTDSKKLHFMLNHNPFPVVIDLPSDTVYADLLSGDLVKDSLSLAGYGVALLELEL